MRSNPFDEVHFFILLNLLKFIKFIKFPIPNPEVAVAGSRYDLGSVS
jgi:hypothetical protein